MSLMLLKESLDILIIEYQNNKNEINKEAFRNSGIGLDCGFFHTFAQSQKPPHHGKQS